MEITDLMIGDWVRLKDDYLSYEESCMKISFLSTSAICALRCKGTNTPIGLKNSDENWMCPVFEDDIEPIPLTEEILENNGFEKDRDYGYFIGQSNSGYYIYFNNNHLSIQAGYDAIEFAWCEYVHELQHALKLCGIKKDIVL